MIQRYGNTILNLTKFSQVVRTGNKIEFFVDIFTMLRSDMRTTIDFKDEITAINEFNNIYKKLNDYYDKVYEGEI
jgi:hypothetical protein